MLTLKTIINQQNFENASLKFSSLLVSCMVVMFGAAISLENHGERLKKSIGIL
jgi:hypothetical protein